MTKRVAAYIRVSTSRQAVNDVSIPDQLKQAERYCAQRGWQLVATFTDPGASARDDKRPEFQRMMSIACVDPSPFDVVLVHSLSRFFRDAVGLGIYTRKLEKHGVSVVSMTQDVGEGEQAEFMRNIFGAFDAYQSAETSKHVKRSMVENARQGYWNGAKPPFGYRAVTVELRGEKAKKHLEPHPKEAPIVHMIFELALRGHGQSGPMGVKQIADHLNTRGYTPRSGAQYRTGYVYSILTKETYCGTHYFNKRERKSQKIRPREEWVPVSVPAIVTPEDFQAVQDQLKSRSPKKVAPRSVNSPVLLSGIAYCGCCGAKLVLTTGKSGKYRYMSCASKHTKGIAGCDTPARLPEAAIDNLVLDALSDQITEPDRLRTLLQEVRRVNAHRKDTADADLKTTRKSLREVEGRIRKLLEAVECGLVGSTATFKKRFSELETEREDLIRLIGVQERASGAPLARVTNAQLKQFSDGLRASLRNGAPAFRKAYLRLLVDRVDVGEKEIRISGSKAALAAAAADRKTKNGGVPSFVPGWRTGEDSNPRPPDS